jgi:hypothetical protein
MWDDEKRKRQAANCRETAPWRFSTGPRSDQGKARVSKNAIKHGLRSGILRKTADFLARSNKILKEI